MPQTNTVKLVHIPLSVQLCALKTVTPHLITIPPYTGCQLHVPQGLLVIE